MRPTAWTLLFALLLQLMLGSAWAMRVTSSHHAAPSCHDSVSIQAHGPEGHSAHAAQDQAPAHTAQADKHHCCAVGLGTGVQAILLPLPQAVPTSLPSLWVSLSLRPDLRPPI